MKHYYDLIITLLVFTFCSGTFAQSGDDKKEKEDTSDYHNPAGNILLSGVHFEYPGFPSMRTLKLKTDEDAAIYFISDNAYIPAYIMSAAAGSTIDDRFNDLSKGQQVRGFTFKGGGGFAKLGMSTYLGAGANFEYLLVGTAAGSGGILGTGSNNFEALSCLGLELAIIHLSVRNVHLMSTFTYQWILNKEQKGHNRTAAELYLTYRIGKLMSLYGSTGYAKYVFTDSNLSSNSTRKYGSLLATMGFAIRI